MAGVGGVCIPVCVGLGPVIGWSLALSLSAVVTCVVVYYLLVLFVLKRGGYSPVISWFNTAVEVSVVVPFVCLDTWMRGADYALSAPPLVLWGGLITLSALRGSRPLSIAAGALAGVEYLVVYGLVVHPVLPDPVLVTFTWPFIALRAFFLLCCGIAASMVTHHLIRKAEEALRAVRSKDLMGKYILHDKLAEGGMGEVYRATYSPEGGFEKPMAVKRILPALSSDPRFVELFLHEARLCATLNHPNVVQVFDVGLFDGAYMLGMEFVDGVTLMNIINGYGRPLPLAAVTFIGIEVARALDYIHRRTASDGSPLGLIHSDVNPPNVLISRIGEVKLGDFGVAHAAEAVRHKVKELRGKLAYMAPEQLLLKPYDTRVDLYGLGLTLYEALTRRSARPKNMQAVVQSGEIPPIQPLLEVRPDVPPELSDVVMQLLSPDPARRPATGRATRQKLEMVQGEACAYPKGPDLLAKACVELLRKADEAKSRADDPLAKTQLRS
jgi:eukaryotic-like serine/threonine-protein kinase